jgi:uncharacterized protein (TIRG00374 family)
MTGASEPPKVEKSARATLVRTLIGVGLLVVVILNVDLAEVARLIRGVEPFYFGLCLALLFLDRFLMAYKWNLLLRAKAIELSFWEAFRIYLVSNYIGLFLPTGVGGDIYRVYHTSRRAGRTEDIAASVILERMMGVVANVALAAVGLIVVLQFEDTELFGHWGTVSIIAFLLCVLAAAWLSMQDFSLSLVRAIRGRWDFSLTRKLLQCQESYLDYRAERRLLAIFFAWTIFEQATLALSNYFAARAIGIEIALLYFLAIIPICRIVIRIPISINAIGVQEGMYVLFFSRMGVSTSSAFTLAVVMRVGHWLVMLPGALLHMHGGSRKDKATMAGK